ncbi:4'-phosphopantetheinyl transferase superfamily protein [Morganella morganii]|nr:4'-phosphopantetheinyl transferase superfamily protein [Morganella morganii]EGT3629334.1 4'-phosphopantetheinyl transferase superfamily protein [Morganella morganii]EGT3633940.1 4'-phosphopantetheinyl transferase superfamily protein [Morganella morganii]
MLPPFSESYPWLPDLAGLLALPQDIRLSGLALAAGGTSIAHAWPLLSGGSLRGITKDMGRKRQTGFLAGRLCACRSLSEMNIAAGFPLPVRDRMPVWPFGVLGSISHCASLAVAMTAPASGYRAVGIDVETVIDPATALDIQHNICSDDELTVPENIIPDRARALTLIFSAKEALYKALYPLVGRYKDFHAAQVTGCCAGTLLLRLTEDWNTQWRSGTHVQVKFAWPGNEVLTAVWLPVVKNNRGC